jgi:uncharacterized membrane protein (DUF485 family)
MHEPNPPSEPENEQSSRGNARLGLLLFFLYFAVYAGFMIVNAFHPELMKLTLGGVNLAIIYGIGLIALAVLLAILYLVLCRASASRGRKPPVEENVALTPRANAPGSPASDKEVTP